MHPRIGFEIVGVGGAPSRVNIGNPPSWVDSIIGSAGEEYSLSVGSNPIRPVSKLRFFPFQPDALDIERNQDPPCGSSSIGRAPAFQVGGCEIIARLSLH